MKILILLGIVSEFLGVYLIHTALNTEGVQFFMSFGGGWLIGWPIGALLGLGIIKILDNMS